MEKNTLSLSVRVLKKYCRSAFDEFVQSLNIERKVRFFALWFPFLKLNGFTLTVGLKNRQTDLVVVNLWPYRSSVITSPQMAYFFLYAVVAHEAKHIQLLQNWQSGCTSYEELFSEWSVRQICRDLLPERLIQQYLAMKGSSDLKKRRYAVSPIELLCYQFGFHEAFMRFSSVFSLEEQKTAQTIIDSIDFINQYLEIDYYSSKQAYNRFTHTINYFSRYIKKRPGIVTRFPQLLALFTPAGMLKSPAQIFAERTEGNTRMVDSILIRLFITMVFDWTEVFAKHKDLYDHMSSLSNDYCAKTVDYLKNVTLGEVFLHKDILQDNAAMLIKNVNTLNKLMDQYGIAHTTGSVLPVYYFDDFSRDGR